MSERKLVVPRGMVECGEVAWDMSSERERVTHEAIRKIVEAAAKSLADCPIIPTDEQMAKLYDWYNERGRPGSFAAFAATEFQRLMFYPEPEIPEEVAAAIQRNFGVNPNDWVKALAMDAFRLGEAQGKAGAK